MEIFYSLISDYGPSDNFRYYYILCKNYENYVKIFNNFRNLKPFYNLKHFNEIEKEKILKYSFYKSQD